eukprot:SAG31_NODE_12234_length_957_cov_0.878788_1_plen_319_part_11
MNLIATGIGIVKDMGNAVVPLILLGKTAAIMLVKALILVLLFLKFVKKKIKRPRIKPPPPVWTIVKMPPPVVDLMAVVLNPALLDLLNNIILQVQPIIGGYLKVFAKLAASWMKEFGAEVLDRQFQQVMDTDHPRTRISLSKYIRKFHRGACIHTYRGFSGRIKELAQTIFNEATRVATVAAETKRAISAGDDLLAAAMAVVDQPMIKKITDLTGPLAPVINEYIKAVGKAQMQWLRDTGQEKINVAMKKLEAIAEAGKEKGPLPEGPDNPTLCISLAVDSGSIEDVDAFQEIFCNNMGDALGVEPDRIGIKDVTAGQT